MNKDGYGVASLNGLENDEGGSKEFRSGGRDFGWEDDEVGAKDVRNGSRRGGWDEDEEVSKDVRIGGSNVASEVTESKQFQIELGCFHPVKLGIDALVFSQGWPSWTLALEGLGFRDIRTLASFAIEGNKREFLSTEMEKTSMVPGALDDWLTSHTKENSVVFVQGDRKFWEIVCFINGQ